MPRRAGPNTTPITLNVPAAWLDAASARARQLTGARDAVTVTTRTDVLRKALERGLRDMGILT